MNNYTNHPLHHNIYFTLASKIIIVADLAEEYLRLKIKTIKNQQQKEMEATWKN